MTYFYYNQILTEPSLCATTSNRNQSNSPFADAVGHHTIAKPQRNFAVEPPRKLREDLLAQIRAVVKGIPGKRGYQPDKQEKLTFTVLEQIEVLFVGWASS